MGVSPSPIQSAVAELTLLTAVVGGGCVLSVCGGSLRSSGTDQRNIGVNFHCLALVPRVDHA